MVARQPIVAVFQRRVPVSSVIPVVTVPVAVTVIVSNPLSLQGVSDADQDIGKQLIGMRVGKCKTRHTRKRQSGNGCLQYVASSQCGHFFGSLKRFNQIGGLTRSGVTGAAIITRASAGTVTSGSGSATLVAGPPSAVARTTGTAAGRIAGAAGTVAAGLLKTIARYLASVIGSPISIKSITNYLISSGRKVSANTVSDYVDALTESFIFYSVDRFDIVGKQLLKVNKKLYMVDLGLRNHILPRKRYDLGFSIENIVFFELLRRGNKVNIGKYGATEVDFVAQKQGVIVYYQVTADMTAEETFEREMRPLQEIKDNYEKIVLTLDQFSLGNYDGIKVINVIDWLLEN